MEFHAAYQHTTPVRLRGELGAGSRLITSRDDSFDESQVQAAHHIPVVASDHVKRAISQADAIVVDVGQVTTPAQRNDDVVNLLTYSGYYDVALRDFGLLLAALTLGRLASVYDPPLRRSTASTTNSSA